MTPTSNPGLDRLATRARRSFAERFGRAATVVVAAPGRVNLIGDHTDYEDGFAVPMAIDRYVVIAAAPQAGPERGPIRLHSATMDETRAIGADATAAVAGDWSRYAAGVVTLAAEAGLTPPAFDAWLESSVPAGAGLSSSAAYEVAVATLIETLAGTDLDPLHKAELCQRAEHEYAGVPCGMMDQIAATLSIPGHAMLLDCRTLETTPIALPETKIAVLIADTGESRDLSSGVYATRRQECRAAAELLDVSTLRDAGPDDLERAADAMPETLLRRARHVITENARVLAFAAALRTSRWADAGRLMDESHDSLRDDFAVTSPALDAMVKLAREIGSAGGVHGARMTGAGLGGCVVALVRPDAAASIATKLEVGFRESIGGEPDVSRAMPVGGARTLEDSR